MRTSSEDHWAFSFSATVAGLMSGRRNDNLLYELSMTLAASGDHTTAIALRMLAQQGYRALDQVDAVPDWILLVIPRMGVKRMMAVRRLTRAEWRPPSPHVVEVATWFLSAARLALRFWPVEALESVIQGSQRPSSCRAAPIEKQIAMDSFILAAQKARLHASVEELVRVVRHCAGDTDLSPNLNLRPFRNLSLYDAEGRLPRGSATPAAGAEASEADESGTESAHYAFPRQKRRQIVEDYFQARDSRLVTNKDQWAWTRHNISGRTLSRYEREYLAERKDRP